MKCNKTNLDHVFLQFKLQSLEKYKCAEMLKSTQKKYNSNVCSFYSTPIHMEQKAHKIILFLFLRSDRNQTVGNKIKRFLSFYLKFT